MQQPQPTPQVGIFSNIYSTIKNIYKYASEKKTTFVVYLLILIFVLNLIVVYSDQTITQDEKFNKAFVKTISSVIVADYNLYQDTDVIFSPDNNVFNDYYQSVGLKYKLLAIWNIIKTFSSLMKDLSLLLFFFFAFYAIIEFDIGEYNIPKPNMYIILLLVTVPILIAVNLSISDQTTDETHFLVFITNKVPLRGLYHLGYTIYHLASDPAYNLVNSNYQSIEPVIYESISEPTTP